MSAQRPAAVLVTGMSGTGKSSALAALAGRGHGVVDTDDPGWKHDVTTATGPEPHLDLDRLRARLDRGRTTALFVAACTVDQGALYDRFDAVVLLSAPLDVLLARVADRANPFGSSARDRARIAADLAAVEPVLRAGATHEIDTTAPLAEVVATLERIAGGTTPPPPPGRA